ncbi:MAG: MoaD/ThiS family protein [Desulfobulbaceae bacterium]|nr:MoaD/ThiS family protein [Desulfobulbaceae bacterium]
MVTLNFKLSNLGSVHSDIATPASFEMVLQHCAAKNDKTFGSVIAVRDGKVVGLQDAVAEGDVIDIYPAISGG